MHVCVRACMCLCAHMRMHADIAETSNINVQFRKTRKQLVNRISQHLKDSCAVCVYVRACMHV